MPLQRGCACRRGCEGLPVGRVKEYLARIGTEWRRLALVVAAPAGPDRPQTNVGGSAVSAAGIWILAIWSVVVALVALYALAVILPPAACGTESCPTSIRVRFFDVPLSLSRESALLLIAMIAGAMGASLHGLKSLARYVGDRFLFRSWLLLYLSLPVVGALLATVFYLVVRAGFISTTGATASSNAFGFAAVSGLVGLFTSQAAEKLKKVFEVLFDKAEPGKDTAPSVLAADEDD